MDECTKLFYIENSLTFYVGLQSFIERNEERNREAGKEKFFSYDGDGWEDGIAIDWKEERKENVLA